LSLVLKQLKTRKVICIIFNYLKKKFEFLFWQNTFCTNWVYLFIVLARKKGISKKNFLWWTNDECAYV